MNERVASHGSRRGYTVVELMAALAIFAIGVTGVAAMQKVTSTSNAHAKNLAIATHLAESWLDRLTTDATNWGTAAGSTKTIWLTSPSGQWIVGPANTDQNWGAGFDALGNYPAASAEDVAFCSHIRLTRVLQSVGTELIRTEVRVFWPREGGGFTGTQLCADANTQPAAIEADPAKFHFVYKSSAVRQASNY